MRILFAFVLIYAMIILVFSMDFSVDGADYMIIPGCRLSNNCETITLTNRVFRAISYLKANPQCKVIVSGGVSGNNTVSEASVMKKILLDGGIRKERIILEDKALNSRERIRFSKEWIEDGSKVIVCSSDYHLFRCKLIGLKNGLTLKSIAARSAYFDQILHLPLEELAIIRDLILK